MKGIRLRTAIAALTLSLGSTSASATAISLTGTDILSNPNVSLPNGSSGTTGSSLEFTGSPESSVIINIDLSALGFGTGAAQSTAGVITVTNTRRTSDSDLWYGLWDGTSFLAFTSFDGNRSQDQTNCGAMSNGTTFIFCGGSVLNFAAVQGIGSAETAIYSFDLLAGSVNFGINSINFNSTIPGLFNSAGSLSFLIGKGSTGELHQIDGLTITDRSMMIPEPVSLLLLGSGMLGLAIMRRRRTA